MDWNRMRLFDAARRLRADQRGVAPVLIVAALAVFGIVSIGVGYAMTSSLNANTALKHNTALEQKVAEAVTAAAATGYDAVVALPASAELTWKVGNNDVTALRTVERNEGARTAKVTIVAGKYVDHKFQPYTACASNPKACVSGSEMVASPKPVSPP